MRIELDETALSSTVWRAGLLPLAFVTLLLSTVIRAPIMNLGFRTTLQGLALIPVFVVAIRFSTWWPCRLLNTRILGRIGALSYTLYLVHFCVLKALVKSYPMHWLVKTAIALPISLAIAQAMYVLVEAPCARIRRRLHREPAPPAAAASEA